MIIQHSTQNTIEIPCLLRQGILFFLLSALTSVFAEPKTGLYVKKEGDAYVGTITCINITAIKKGSITCKYDSSVNIDKVAIGALKTSIALGASLDRTNRLLYISISATGTLTIDSSSLVLIKMPVSNASINHPLSLQSVTFTDKQGATINPKFIDITSIRRGYSIKNELAVNSYPVLYYLLNGAVLPVKRPGDILDNRKKIVPGQQAHR